jgi:nucleoside 2-deoxyribosyltransferase
MRKPIVYTAGPLGFSEVGRAFHNGTFVPMLERLGFEVLDPWKLTPDELVRPVLDMPYGQAKKSTLETLNIVIGRNNRNAIQACDLVVAVLDGTDVDSGTAAEVGYAAGLNKPIEGYRGDFRRASDNDGSVVNLQVEFFMMHHSYHGRIATNMSELEANLLGYLRMFSALR